MLMDLFFESVALSAKRRIHFNAFMTDAHVRIHAERQRRDVKDPLPPVARALAADPAIIGRELGPVANSRCLRTYHVIMD